MPDKLYLPPGRTDADFIKVGDDCYERVEETDIPPTINEIDGEFESCDCEDSSSSSSSSSVSCCGPIGDCCFSENTTITFNNELPTISWTPTGNIPHDNFIAELLTIYENIKNDLIPVVNCLSNGIGWQIVSTQGAIDPSDDEVRYVSISINYDGVNWSLRVGLSSGDASLQGFYHDDISAAGDSTCCDAGITLITYDEGFAATYQFVLSSTEVTAEVNSNECCNDNGMCITGADKNCDGKCDSSSSSSSSFSLNCSDLTCCVGTYEPTGTIVLCGDADATPSCTGSCRSIRKRKYCDRYCEYCYDGNGGWTFAKSWYVSKTTQSNVPASCNCSLTDAQLEMMLLEGNGSLNSSYRLVVYIVHWRWECKYDNSSCKPAGTPWVISTGDSWGELGYAEVYDDSCSDSPCP